MCVRPSEEALWRTGGEERAGWGAGVCLSLLFHCFRSMAEFPVSSLGFSGRQEQAKDTDAGTVPTCTPGSTSSDWWLLVICWWWPENLFVVVTVTQVGLHLGRSGCLTIWASS